jgi:hypothetical protein
MYSRSPITISGRVYVAEVEESALLPTKAQIAIKKTHITKHVTNSMLRHEAAALLMIGGTTLCYHCVLPFLIRLGHPSIPKVYAWGKSQYYEYIALQLLGPTVSSLCKEEFTLTLRNLIAITCQMVSIFRCVCAFLLTVF